MTQVVFADYVSVLIQEHVLDRRRSQINAKRKHLPPQFRLMAFKCPCAIFLCVEHFDAQPLGLALLAPLEDLTQSRAKVSTSGLALPAPAPQRVAEVLYTLYFELTSQFITLSNNQGKH